MASRETLAKLARMAGLKKIADAIIARDKKNTKAGKRAEKRGY